MYIFVEECLLSYKNWCIVLVTFLSIPLCLFCWAVNLDLAWTYYFTGILIASSVVPIAFSILWARATATGKNHAAFEFLRLWREIILGHTDNSSSVLMF